VDTLEAYQAGITRYDRITPEAEQTADVQTLIKSNLRLVWKIGNGYTGRGVALPELISAGNVGLIRAAEEFDPSMGNRFSTYAAWWIIQYMMREIEAQGIVRYPNNVIRDAQRLIRRNYDRAGLDMSDSAFVLAQRAFLPGLSLSDPISETYPTAKETTLEDDAPDQLQGVIDARRVEFVEFCLSRLDDRAADIVRRYYGIGNCVCETMQEIGATHKLSKERVRQILKDSKRKLQYLKREGEEWLR